MDRRSPQEPQAGRKRKRTQASAAKSGPQSKTNNITHDRTTGHEDDHVNHKIKAQGQVENVIDLTGDDDEDAAPSKRSKKGVRGGEKRLKQFRKQAPQKIAAVVHRATTQRMVVIDRRRMNTDDCPHRNPNCPIEEVDLAGSTGNVYTVRVTHIPECTCPDFRIRNNPQCKHILYVLLKVLKTPEPLHYQAAFLTSELEEIFNHAGPLPTETVNVQDKDGKRKPIEGDCPICCEELSAETETETIVWCQTCGNNEHKTCFEQWAATKGNGLVTCPYCRAPWQNEIADGSALKELTKMGTKNQHGYINVASQLGMSGRRDYSTYHVCIDHSSLNFLLMSVASRTTGFAVKKDTG